VSSDLIHSPNNTLSTHIHFSALSSPTINLQHLPFSYSKCLIQPLASLDESHCILWLHVVQLQSFTSSQIFISSCLCTAFLLITIIHNSIAAEIKHTSFQLLHVNISNFFHNVQLQLISVHNRPKWQNKYNNMLVNIINIIICKYIL